LSKKEREWGERVRKEGGGKEGRGVDSVKRGVRENVLVH